MNQNHVPPTPYRFTPEGPYVPPTFVAPHRKKSPVKGIIAVVVGLTLLALCGVGVISAVSAGNATPAGTSNRFLSPAGDNPIAKVSDPAPVQTIPAAGKILTPADVHLTVQITRQKCFGSAGCNLDFHVTASWPDGIDFTRGGYQVTYEVAGVEDGPQINTLQIVDTDTYTADTDESASTSSRVKSLKAKVTGVEQ